MPPNAGTVSLDTLNAAEPEAFAASLAGIVEHAPEIARAVAGRRPFATVSALHEAFFAVIAELPRADRVALVNRHPELAGREAEAGEMTRESVAEQGSAGLDRLSRDEAGRLRALNAAYRARFGFPFMICVRRHTRASLFREAERRLERSEEEELAEALRQIFFVTRLRIVDRVRGAGPPRIAASLSLVLTDRLSGEPAADCPVELRERAGAGPAILLRRMRTDGQGRALLLEGGALRIGDYELTSNGIGPGCDASRSETALAFAIDQPEEDTLLLAELSGGALSGVSLQTGPRKS